MPNDFDLFLGVGLLTMGILLIIIGAHKEWW